MTAGGFSADTERLARYGGEFAAHARQAGDILATLRSTLEHTQGCWGADEVGRSFAAGYQAVADGALQRLGGLPDQLGDVGSRFVATAAAYRQAEADGVGALRSVVAGE